MLKIKVASFNLGHGVGIVGQECESEALVAEVLDRRWCHMQQRTVQSSDMP